ncbi:MAG TPA: HAD-IA family hydrolase [Acidimicrobiales bacterium]|nr:HAD-IA family hydrolase [Acidimicrobiales bacterium]
MSSPSLGPVLGATPDVVAFGAIGTLFSPAALLPRLAAAGGDATTLESWLARLGRDGLALGLAGDWRTYHDVAKAALASLLPAATDAALEHALSGFAELDAHPDGGPAMGRAVQGARVVVVTNLSGATACALLERNGLDAFVEAVVSADDAGAWKPAAPAYHRAAAVAGVPPERLALVSSHPWDVHGARRAGLLTGWCNRSGDTYPATFQEADLEGPGLLEVVEGFLAFTP